MARAIHVPSGTGDVQVVPAGGSTVVGFTLTAGTGTGAAVYLRNGTSDADPIVAIARLGGAGTVHVSVPSLDCPDGVFLDRDGANAAEAIVYVL